jgi:hypothetical protein
VTFSLFGVQKVHLREGRHESKEKYLVYFGLRIRLPTQFQLLGILLKIPKIQNSAPPTVLYVPVLHGPGIKELHLPSMHFLAPPKLLLPFSIVK